MCYNVVLASHAFELRNIVHNTIIRVQYQISYKKMQLYIYIVEYKHVSFKSSLVWLLDYFKSIFDSKIRRYFRAGFRYNLQSGHHVLYIAFPISSTSPVRRQGAERAVRKLSLSLWD